MNRGKSREIIALTSHSNHSEVICRVEAPIGINAVGEGIEPLLGIPAEYFNKRCCRGNFEQVFLNSGECCCISAPKEVAPVNETLVKFTNRNEVSGAQLDHIYFASVVFQVVYAR